MSKKALRKSLRLVRAPEPVGSLDKIPEWIPSVYLITLSFLDPNHPTAHSVEEKTLTCPRTSIVQDVLIMGFEAFALGKHFPNSSPLDFAFSFHTDAARHSPIHPEQVLALLDDFQTCLLHDPPTRPHFDIKSKAHSSLFSFLKRSSKQEAEAAARAEALEQARLKEIAVARAKAKLMAEAIAQQELVERTDAQLAAEALAARKASRTAAAVHIQRAYRMHLAVLVLKRLKFEKAEIARKERERIAAIPKPPPPPPFFNKKPATPPAPAPAPVAAPAAESSNPEVASSPKSPPKSPAKMGSLSPEDLRSVTLRKVAGPAESSPKPKGFGDTITELMGKRREALVTDGVTPEEDWS
jgi:hypothetical protein